jgi:hypothetical protein
LLDRGDKLALTLIRWRENLPTHAEAATIREWKVDEKEQWITVEELQGRRDVLVPADGLIFGVGYLLTAEIRINGTCNPLARLQSDFDSLLT